MSGRASLPPGGSRAGALRRGAAALALALAACAGRFVEVDCANQSDDDQDGRVDCRDSDCGSDPACSSTVCEGLSAVELPFDPVGDTTGRPNLADGSCQDEGGGDVAFSVTALQTGVLSAVLTPEAGADLGLIFKESCSVGEIACADSGGAGASEAAAVGISAGEVIFVLVGAFDDATEGGFTLSLRLRAAECGDGRVEPPEACDDGGQAPGDGCDALCQAEPGFFCSAAPAGQEGANAGDTSADGLPRSFRGSCVGSLTTPEAIFLFAAAQGGDLRAELDAESDHGLYARSACEGGEELGCADDVGAGGAPEVLVIRGLAAGEGAAIFVEAAAGAEPGPFTLALSLQ